jgi:hypothetical protein
MKILFLYENELLIDFYKNDDRIIFKENYKIEGSSFKKISLRYNFKTSHSFYGLDQNKIIRLLLLNNPIWSRWSDRGDEFEHYYRYALKKIMYHVSYLKEMGITHVVFPTSVPHHIDTLIFSIACRIIDIKQIFLYNILSLDHNAFYGRLIPLIQDKSIFDRRPLGCKVSDYNHGDDVKNFKEFLDNLKIKKGANMFDNSSARSVWYSSLNEIKYIFKKKFVRIYKPYLKEDRLFKGYSLITKLKNIRDQSKALKLYDKKKVIINDKLDSEIIIMAHYQPEATSFPEGGNYHNHIDIVFALRSKGYDKTIYYKEHPSTWMYTADIVGSTKVAQYRSEEYYKYLLDMGCVFLDEKSDLDLFNKSNLRFLPVTITGSIAIERSILGLYTIYTGQPYWKGLPGTIHIDDIKNFKDLNTFFKFDQKIRLSAIRFFKKILDKKTIINYLGFSTGNKCKDNKIRNTFLKEHNKMTEFILKS